jgi:hypothetical protein
MHYRPPAILNERATKARLGLEGHVFRHIAHVYGRPRTAGNYSRGTWHVALVALARRLAGILYALLRDGTVYAPRRPAALLTPSLRFTREGRSD